MKKLLSLLLLLPGLLFAAPGDVRMQQRDAGNIAQPVDLPEVLNGLIGFNGTGDLYSSNTPTLVSAILSGQSLTAAQATPLLDLSTTWNTTGMPTAIKLRVTDTASNGGSLLMDLGTVASGSLISADKFGTLYLDTVEAASLLLVSANSYLNSTQVRSPAVNTSSQSLTGSQFTPTMDLTTTWDTTGTPTAIKLRVTNTASNAASLLMDLGTVAGGSLAKVTLAGEFTSSGGLVLRDTWPSGTLNSIYGSGSGGIAFTRMGSVGFYMYPSSTDPQLVTTASGSFGWSSSAINATTSTPDVVLFRDAAAVLRLGADHATVATAQSIKAHDVTTGAGASLTLAGGKGSVAGGALILATSATNGAPVARVTVGADGNTALSGNLTLSSTTATIVGSATTDTLIRTNSADASDNKSVTLHGGGANSVSRGGSISAYGNEVTTNGGSVQLYAGNDTDGHIVFGVAPYSTTATTMMEYNSGDWGFGMAPGNNPLSRVHIVADSNPQLTVSYSTGNDVTIGSSSTGAITYNASGSGASHTFPDKVITGERIKLKGYTLAQLNALASLEEGDTAYCTDALAPTYLIAITGGGAIKCPAFYNGTAWVSH